MGNCQACQNFDQDKKNEFDDSTMKTPYNKSVNKVNSKYNTAKNVQFTEQGLNSKKKFTTSGNTAEDQFRKIVKIQSLFRMFKAKKNYKYQIKVVIKDTFGVIHFFTLQGKNKYFMDGEFWETISATKKWSPNSQREKRNYTYQCSGGKYVGEWRGGFRDGDGMMKWPDGACYIGEWKDNHAFGRGKFVHVSGDVYEGSWMRDRANGFGVYKSADGGVYSGYWLDDQQHEHGIEKWSDGSSYEGQYQFGFKSGFGSYVWPNGSMYKGEWSKNVINGIGIQYWNDGRRYEGEFQNNLMNGFGFYTFADGKTYEGYYVNDKKHGYGIYTWTDGKTYSGWWSYGKQDGYAIYTQYLPNDTQGGGGSSIDVATRQGLWKDGKKVKWLDEDQVEEVKSKRLEAESNKKINKEQKERLTFEKPTDFEDKAYTVRSKISQLKFKYKIE